MALAITLHEKPLANGATALIARIESAYGVSEYNAMGATPHDGCAGNGTRFMVFGSWSDDTYCTGCDYHASRSTGD